MLNNGEPVPYEEYDRTYFLTDCGGYQNFVEHQGLKIDERISKSLKLANIEPNMTILDVGGNTGKFSISAAKFNSDVQMTILDLPGQLAVAEKNIATDFSDLYR